MRYYSTRRQSPLVSLAEAVLKGLPEDNGLYMPERLPQLSSQFIEQLPSLSFEEIAYGVASALLGEDIPPEELRRMVQKTLGFDAPVVWLSQQTGILELFHGPTLAFKDFGARFMAQAMSYFLPGDGRPLHILVATSGDTGSAVAHGFLGVEGITVAVLYPKGKVSPFQEKQFATLGRNITALEIDGTFDHCQALVKQAFLDKELNQKLRLSSANSINISRLIPQAFYYVYAWAQAVRTRKQEKIYFVVPSGNFGNLTAGVLARQMGLPVAGFIAATNVNDVVPRYLQTGKYEPRPSIPTISNAMDVGNPSNFARLAEWFPTWEAMRQNLYGYAFTDEQTRQAMRRVYQQYGYMMDPHGAVGYLAWEAFCQEYQPANAVGIILETAHPVKFSEVVTQTLGQTPTVPERLQHLMTLPKLSIPLPKDFATFKNFLMQYYEK
ncbi:MAG: threonine synthase [Cytophagales bacterium]|nr:threonine synthase [Bernardetiaceae bacterium]MDW8210254.1 threonine synthase [Cytophagales bacterium]